ncbi:potassium channel subfamily U member 1 [Echinops telfairi]|uniref:Potassium channel subfamily U member 1 n=1 Tax=Echinops telfairi TaxID=9371 RepID=A0AC55CTJ0_ECHTE|nr:potassium channel subfamily U member 1 [Echinops telfairi]
MELAAILVFVLSIGSLIIYFINSTDPVGSCSSYEDVTIPVDLTFNAFFSFYFGLRFLAADDKIKFWMEMNSIVDIFTIPPTFISYYLKSNWLGLRFLRALRLLELPQILQSLQAIKTSSSVKFSKLLSIIFSTCFTAAGFIHLFSKYIPEMVELFANKRKYITSYEVVKGKKFIMVCGNITVDSVSAFLSNFLRFKSTHYSTEIVFMGENPPSLELETLLKSYMAYTTFISGSVLKWEDLKRVAVEYAEACLIIANPLCSDSHAEDISNIMRVLSIKNYCPNTRVIIQILQSHNKVYLPKIPSWNWKLDNIICFAELKLGFIAQGCQVPGLCTFLTSLFVELNKKVIPKHLWKKQFINGLKNKILTQRLSDDFEGMTFPEVSMICFTKLNLMLIAIEHKSAFTEGFIGLILNPSAQVRLHKNTIGFFIAESAKEVKRALFYCSTCHSDVNNPEIIAKCGCKTKGHRQNITEIPEIIRKRSPRDAHLGEVHDHIPLENSSFVTYTSFSARNIHNENDHHHWRFDTSGMFHWCKATPFDKVILKRSDKKTEFRNHVVACVFGDAHSTLMGLRNFVMPLRASNYTLNELKDIVFIGSLDYLQREWRFLRNFPQIYILPGSALYSGDLHAANVQECSMCAVLSPPYKHSLSQMPVDTETIMATLNIGALRISCSAPAPSMMPGLENNLTGDQKNLKERRIPILTELRNPSNIHLIEQLGGIQGSLRGTNLHLSTSFSTGAVFSGSFLDSLLATAFYNYRLLELLQMLVTGGISAQLEQHLDKERHCEISDSFTAAFSLRARCKLGLLSLKSTILSNIKPSDHFGQLFCGSLTHFGILCLGLYRKINGEDCSSSERRFVITRPSKDFKLLPSDLVFCAIPFNTSYDKKDASSPQLYEPVNLARMQKSLDLYHHSTTTFMNKDSESNYLSAHKQTMLSNKDKRSYSGENVRENPQKIM